MHPIARRILGAAAAAIARKLLPEDPGTALALRSDGRLAPIVDHRPEGSFLPTSRPSQNLYAPAPPPAPRLVRRIVIVEETITRRY